MPNQTASTDSSKDNQNAKNADATDDKKAAEGAEFVSKLDKPEQRFLAHVIEHGLNIGRRSAADFVRHFPPNAIMDGLDRRPDLRADILVETTGVRHQIALRKSAASSGDDLQIALDEGIATPAEIVALFRPDDRVRYLDPVALWTYIIEGEFWKTDRSRGAMFDRAKQHIAFMLERALADKLISHTDLVEGVSVDALAESLPRQTLGDIIKAALSMGRNKQAFTEADLLATAAARVLVEDVSLVHIWETVIVPKIAEAQGFVAAAEAPKADKAKEKTDKAEKADKAEAKAEKADSKAKNGKDTKPAVKKMGKKPAAKAAARAEDGPPRGAGDLDDLLVDVDDFEIEEIEEEYETQVTATGGGGGRPN